MFLNPVYRPLGPTIVFVAAASGVVLSVYNYLAPLTGVNGTPGALLVVGSGLALAVDGLVLAFRRRGLLFGVFWALGLLGSLGTLTAAIFLHEWSLSMTTMVVLVGLVATLGTQVLPRRAAA